MFIGLGRMEGAQQTEAILHWKTGHFIQGYVSDLCHASVRRADRETTKQEVDWSPCTDLAD